MVLDDLSDDEGEELLGEDRIQAGLLGQGLQTCHLLLLAPGVGRRQIESGLEQSHLLSAAEPFGQEMDEGGVEVVNGGPIDGQLWGDCLLYTSDAADEL